MKNWLTFLFFLGTLEAWAQSPLILRTVGEGEILLYPYAEALWQENRDNADFRTFNPTNLPTQASSFWLKYRILNDTDHAQSAIINLGYFEQVTLYHYNAAGKLLKQEATGMIAPLAQRGLPIDAQILERVQLEKGENTLCLHVTQTQSIHLSNLAYSLKRVSLRVEKQNYELSYFNGNDRIFILMYLGAVVLMFLYNGVIYTVLLDRNYLYYILYLFFAGAYFFINKGLYVEWVASDAPQSKLLLSYLSLTLALMFQLLFTRRFLELKQKLVWGSWLIMAMLGLVGLVWACMLLGIYGFLRNFMALSVMLSFLSMLAVGAVMTMQKHKSAYYYITGNAGLIMGALVFSLLTMNYLPSKIYTENAGLLGVLFEMSLFSLGLANKINEAKKELAKRKLEEERREKALIESKNRELEGKVRERTKDLQQTNEELLQTLDMIELQRNQIAEKNQKLVSSINYARRIQSATLPNQDNIAQYLPQFFTFYQPKDIVSGDFYWFTTVQIPLAFANPTNELFSNGQHYAYSPQTLPALTNAVDVLEHEPESKEMLFWVVADCTGHGVPGAFMTILGETLLDQIINRDKIYAPAKVLTELDKRLLKILQQDGQNTKIDDGMDMTLMRLDREERKICWASAKRSIWVFEAEKDEPTIYKGDKFPIGGTRAKDLKAYTENEFFVKPQDAIYTFTDGITDQFRGNEKFTPSRLKVLLNEYKDQDMSIQHNAIAQAFFDWKGDTPQTDDVLLLGLRM